MKLYVAGPMTGIKDYNFPAFLEAAKQLRLIGHHVICPAEEDITNGMVKYDWQTDQYVATDTFDYQDALKADFGYIVGCDAIVLLDGWENSKGACAERFVAEMSGLSVLEYDPTLVLKLKQASLRNATLTWQDPTTEAVDTSGKHDSGEVRVVDPITGGAKGSKLCQLGAIDPLALKALGEVAGFGAAKYDRWNYAKGFKHSLAVDALFRHALEALAGNDMDDESGLPHWAHAAWQCLCLLTFQLRGLGTDDRFPTQAVDTSPLGTFSEAPAEFARRTRGEDEVQSVDDLLPEQFITAFNLKRVDL